MKIKVVRRGARRRWLMYLKLCDVSENMLSELWFMNDGCLLLDIICCFRLFCFSIWRHVTWMFLSDF
jgi:hypothetical protein